MNRFSAHIIKTLLLLLPAIQLSYAYAQSPGNVSTNLQLWLKADAGVYEDKNSYLVGIDPAESADDVLSWECQSGSRTNAATSHNLNTPPNYYSTTAKNLNYNPSIEFNGNDDALDFGDDYLFSTNSGLVIYAVVHPDDNATQTRQYICDFGLFEENGYGIMYGSDYYGFYTPINEGGASSYDNAMTKDTCTALVNFGITFGTTQDFYVNSLLIASQGNTLTQLTTAEIFETAIHDTYTGPFTIGRQSKTDFIGLNGGRYYDGRIAELILYDNVLTATENQKISSYLAIKYGIPLGNTSNTVNYLASDGNTVWTGDATYQNDIAGIGRDDNSTLNQKQSTSSQPDAIVTMALGAVATTNADNLNSFSADKSFLIWGNNDEAINAHEVADLPATMERRIARIWKTSEYGTVGSVRIEFNLSAIAGPSGAGTNDLSKVRLLVDTDETFATGATIVAATAYDNGTDIIQFDHNFEAGSGFYFSLGSIDAATAPLPITLLSFSAEPRQNSVYLQWQTASEQGCDYFEIQRSDERSKWTTIGKTKALGTTSLPQNYSFTDRNIGFGTYYYRLKQVDINGESSYTSIQTVYAVDKPAVDIQFSKKSNSIEMHLSMLEYVENIAVYDIKGACILRQNIGKSIKTYSMPFNMLSGFYLVKIGTKNNQYRKSIMSF